jgi:hypothetical protein
MSKNDLVTLQRLSQRLQASRARLLRKQILQLSLRAGIVATGVFLLVELTRYVRLLPSPESAGLIAAVGVLALMLVVGLGRIWLSAPDIMDMARLADRRFDLEECLSTALELESAEPKNELTASLHKALWQDIAARLEHVRPQELVVMPFPRQAWYLVTALAAVLALQLAPTPLPTPTVTAQPAMSAEELAEAAIAAQRAAAIAAQDAKWRNDPYLHAVALALEQFARNVEQGGVSPEVAEAELSRLANHLVRAYGLEERVNSGATFDEIMSSAQRPQEDTAADPSSPDGEGDQALADEDAEGGMEAGQGPADGHSDQEGLDGNGVGEANGEAGQEQGAQASQASEGEEADVERQWRDGYDDVDPELQARLDRERQIQEQVNREALLGRDFGAEMGEDLEEESEGDGIGAGTGSQALFGEDEDAFWINGGPDDFELPFNPESRRRIRVEMPPQARLAEVGEGQTGENSGDDRQREAPISSEFLSSVKRHIASQYFLSLRQAENP